MTLFNGFSLLLAIGASFGLFQIALESLRSQRNAWLLAGSLTLFGSLVGARLGYVLENLHYFGAHAGQIAAFWLGGLTWEGALAGGLLALILEKKIWQWSFFSLLDRLSLLLLPVGIAGWLGCWLTGVAYGQTLPNGVWWGIHTLDESGTLALRVPVQLLAAISLAVFLGFSELIIQRGKVTGWRGSLLTLIFSADMLLFSFLRADPAQTWLGLRFESWAALVYTVLSSAAILWILYKKGKLDKIVEFIKKLISKIEKLIHEIKSRTRTNKHRPG
jgi:phosphatidylglycerol:prolipoprotein diacylglycerol transferase